MLFNVSYQNPESEAPFDFLGFVTATTPEEALQRAIATFGHITLHPAVEPDNAI